MFHSPLVAWAAQLPNYLVYLVCLVLTTPCRTSGMWLSACQEHEVAGMATTKHGSTLATEPGSQNPAAARSCPCLLELGPGKSPGIGPIAWVKVTEEFRDLGTEWKRLEREICNTLFPSRTAIQEQWHEAWENTRRVQDSSISQRVDTGRQA